MKITIKSVNIETGEETIFEREETDQEKTERLAAEKEFTTRKSEAEAKQAQRQAIADRLGLTLDELKLLLG